MIIRKIFFTIAAALLALASPALSSGVGFSGIPFFASSAPDVFTASGTWKHPNPGASYAITVQCIGGGGGGGGSYGGVYGGGGGGSGRVTFYNGTVTADQTVTIGTGSAGGAAGAAGSAGNTTTFGALCSAAGGGAGNFGTNPAGVGGSGGFGGGGGGGGSGTGGIGGDGLDFIAGGGGGGSGSSNVAGRSLSGVSGTPGGLSAVTGANYFPGWPNGGNTTATQGQGGLGGSPVIIFPLTQGYGAGGRGGDATGTTAGTTGKNGIVLVWVQRQ